MSVYSGEQGVSVSVSAAQRSPRGFTPSAADQPSAAPDPGPGVEASPRLEAGRLLALVPAEAVADTTQVFGWLVVGLEGKFPFPSPLGPLGRSDTHPVMVVGQQDALGGAPSPTPFDSPTPAPWRTPTSAPSGTPTPAPSSSSPSSPEGDSARQDECDGSLHVDLGRRVVTAHGQPVDLTYTEFEILAALVSRAGAAVSREELIQLVWADGAPDGAAAKGLNVHVHRLRRKLGEELSRRLRTLRGFGYRYDA